MNPETATQTSQLGAKLQLGEVEAEVEPEKGNSGQGRRLPTEPEEVSKEGSKRKLCSFSKADSGSGSFLKSSVVTRTLRKTSQL